MATLSFLVASSVRFQEGVRRLSLSLVAKPGSVTFAGVGTPESADEQ